MNNTVFLLISLALMFYILALIFERKKNRMIGMVMTSITLHYISIILALLFGVVSAINLHAPTTPEAMMERHMLVSAYNSEPSNEYVGLLEKKIKAFNKKVEYQNNVYNNEWFRGLAYTTHVGLELIELKGETANVD